VLYWYKELSHYWDIPLIIFDTPYNYGDIRSGDIQYMTRQFEEMIPELERISQKKYSDSQFSRVISIARESAFLWGEVLATMKHRPAPMTIFDAFIHLAPIVSLRGLPVALDYYRLLLNELK